MKWKIIYYFLTEKENLRFVNARYTKPVTFATHNHVKETGNMRMIGLEIPGRDDVLYKLDLNENVGQLLCRIEETEKEQGRTMNSMTLNFGKWEGRSCMLTGGFIEE